MLFLALAAASGANAQQMIQLELKLSWREVGPVELQGERLKLPKIENVPGLYRFEMKRNKSLVYIGEAENLRARVGRYRNRGEGQSTSVRICAALRQTLKDGGKATVSVVTQDAWLCPPSGCARADLNSRNARRLLEQLAIFSEPTDVEVLNNERTPVRTGFRICH